MIYPVLDLSLIILSVAVLLLLVVVGILITRKFRKACEVTG